MTTTTNRGKCVRAGATLGVVLLLSACALDLGNKTFSRNVDDVAITDKWTPASITIGDPQVFTRATLLNDRRREHRFIETLIQDSRNQKFEPQLQRDLRTLAIATAQLGISYDPAARANFRHEQEINLLRHEVNKRRLQAEIARLDAEIQRIENQSAVEVPAPVGKVDLTNSALQTPSGAPSAEARALLTELQAKLTDILKDVGGPDGRVAATDSHASPEDNFRDLQAYRGLLRAYEASNALDDTHDLAGNTFYRLQFRATVNPEAIRDRFGVIEVEFGNQASTISNDDITQLYWTWLGHVTRQLNQRRAVNPATLSLLPEDSKLFGIVTLERASIGESVRMAVPPAYEKALQDAVNSLERARGPRNKTRQLKKGIDYLRNTTGFVKSTDVCPQPSVTGLNARVAKRRFPLYDQLARAYALNFPPLVLVLSNLIDLSHSGDIDLPVEEIESISERHHHAYSAAQEYIRTRIGTLEEEQGRLQFGGVGIFSSQELEIELAGCRQYLSFSGFTMSGLFPEKFRELLIGDARSRIRVLDVTPAERAQRVSTLASAAASLQTALSIAAALPTAGIGINAGFSNLKAEIGKIEARERVPLIVGFIAGGRVEQVSRRSLTAENGDTPFTQRVPQDQPARFGWVLGPPLKPDLSESQLKHSQALKSHDIQVDLSVPAWWSSVDLSVRTAWAGPLGRSVAGSCDECAKKTFKVTLPRSASDMDALTQFLFSKLSINHPIASDRPRIVEVSPSTIDRSARPLTLIVQGSGLWRGEEVFVYGVRQDNVTVLPDMSGLAVTLNPSSLPRLNRETDAAPLAVFTRAGKAVFEELELIEPQSVPASGLALTSALPYHVNKTPLELQLRSGSFPLGANPKIAFRPSVQGQNYKFAEVPATLTASRSIASATVNWTGDVSMTSGDTIAVRYLYQPDDNTAPIWSEDVSLVYYKDGPEAAAAFDDVDVKAKSTTTVRLGLKLPKRASEAYPLLFDAKTTVKATVGTATLRRNGGMLEVTVTPPTGGFSVGQIMLEFVNPKAGAGALPIITGTLTAK